MIKVNLLRDKTVQARSSISIKPQASALGWMLLAVMAATGGGLWATRYFLQRELDSLSGTRTRLTLENTRLQGLRKQIDRYEKLKRESQGRIDVIEQLKINQTGPVLLMNHIIHSIPGASALWLTALDQKGDQLRITGFTVRGENIPDFMSNLSATGFFKTVDLELYEDQPKETAAKFILVCVGTQKKRTE
jgi:Tfp pilus assembly protein PilN